MNVVLDLRNMSDIYFPLLHRILNQSYSYTFPAILFVVISLFATFRAKTRIYDFPVYGNDKSDPEAHKNRWMKDSMNLLREGCAKYPNSIFQIWTTEGNQLVLPSNYIDELKMKPDTEMPSALIDSLQGHHTTFSCPDKPNRAELVIKHELNKNMHKLFPGIKTEIDHSLPKEFPQGLHEWTAINFYPIVCRLIFHVSGRAFTGPTLHRNNEWMALNINYTRDVFRAALVIKTYPGWLRPYAKYFVPEIRRIWKDNAQATGFLKPLIEERNNDEKNPDFKAPNDTVEWVRRLCSDKEKKDYEYQAIEHLTISAAAIHTTSQLLTNVIFDLAARPEYLPELREEVRIVLARHDGEWTIDSMNELKKMDSFIKESQRYSPNIVSFQRKAVKPITLSDGTRIPKGAFMLAPAEAISRDRNVYDNPEQFDGWRYYKKRQVSGEENKHMLVSTGNTELHFGGGRHACPGRWFASHEIKLILSALIMEYDMKTKEGIGRPKNILFQAVCSPDPTAEIMFKSRVRN